MSELEQVTIYTDGSCDPNPGPGGYGVVLLFGAYRRELSGGFRLTTNNRMEIYAAIRGLDAQLQRAGAQPGFVGATAGIVRKTPGDVYLAQGTCRDRRERALRPACHAVPTPERLAGR